MNIWSTLEKATEVYPEKIAVVDGTRRLSYAETRARSGTLGLLLQELGITRSDRVAILEANSHWFLESYYAVAGIGAILCPLNIRLAPAEIAGILTDAGARCLIAGPQFAGCVHTLGELDHPLEHILWTSTPSAEEIALPATSLEEVIGSHPPAFTPEPVGGDDVAHLYYTSGTTGRPKGVMLTHDNVCTHAVAAIEELALGDGDIWGHIAPMFHLADAWATFAVTWAGGRHVMCPRFEAGEVLDAIESERVTITNLIPTMLNLMNERLKDHDYDLSSLRAILSGGAPIAPDLVRSIIESFGCEYVQTYGMTETSPYLTLSLLASHLRQLPPEKQLAYKARTGRPFAAVELRVVDDHGREVSRDDRQVGEIWVRGPTVTPGYWNRPEETRKAFSDGWLKTGDLATIEAEGYVNIVDRKKDMIITGGENVYSIEVENILYAHPDVLEAAVFGAPDPKWGEKVCAAVALRQGCRATEQELIAYCKQHLAGYKAPKSITFLEALPRTGSGKITKKPLRSES